MCTNMYCTIYLIDRISEFLTIRLDMSIKTPSADVLKSSYVETVLNALRIALQTMIYRC